MRDDDSAFRKVIVGDWGWSVRWSDDMEIGADTLHRLTLEQGGDWLAAWRRRHRMTEREAAARLGLTLRQWKRYENKEQLLPLTVRLACLGVDAMDRAA